MDYENASHQITLVPVYQNPIGMSKNKAPRVPIFLLLKARYIRAATVGQERTAEAIVIY